MAIAPHNYNSVLCGLAATVQVSAVIPHFLIAEYFVNFADACAAVATSAIKVVDGWAEFGDTPGLGVEFDIDALRARPYQPFASKGLTQYWDEFPRKDYVPGLG